MRTNRPAKRVLGKQSTSALKHRAVTAFIKDAGPLADIAQTASIAISLNDDTEYFKAVLKVRRQRYIERFSTRA